MSQSRSSLSVVVCQGPSCSLMGSKELLAWCDALKSSGLPVDFEVSGCTGNCLESPVVEWNGRYITECSPEQLTARLIEEDCL